MEDTCLTFDDDQWGSWNAPNCEAITASNWKDLEEEQIKEINIPVHCNPGVLVSSLYENDEYETAKSS